MAQSPIMYGKMNDSLRQELGSIREAGLYKEERAILSPQAADIWVSYPADSPQRPENLAAAIYRSLGLPATAAWRDSADRPHHIYHGEPIAGLM